MVKKVLIKKPSSAFSWKTLKIGAGGFITGIDIAIDGTKVIRTDTYGGYKWNGSAWVQLVTTNSMPAADSGFDASGDNRSDGGVYAICIAPSNTARFYMLYKGYVFRSDNSGVTWTRTAFTQVSGCDPNDSQGNPYHKLTGPKIAVDPQNADVCYVGTAADGMFKTADAGASWTHDTGVATSTTAHAVIIAFDPSSSVVGGKKQGIYASSYGRGVYHSTDGGANWTLTTGTPTTHVHMVCSVSGIVWLTAASGTHVLWKYASATWTNVNSGSQTGRGQSIAIDPADEQKMYVGIDSGDIITSTNGGANWTNPSFANTRSGVGDVPWLGATSESYMSLGDMMFDPSQSHVLYFAEGIGVWKTAVPGATTAWTSQSAGIEQLVTNMVLVPPAGKPVVCCWDRPVFYSANLDAYPSGHGPNYDNAIVMGWHADYSPADAAFVVGLFNWFGAEESGYSSNGGQTWTNFAAVPPLMTDVHIGGSIAAGSNTNFVWVANGYDGVANDGTPYYTTNGGASWTQVSISGVPTTGETGWGHQYPNNRHILCADRVNANTFYMYNNGAESDASFVGVYKSTNSGVDWTRVKTTRFTGYSIDYFNAILRAVPLNAGHLFYTGGNVGGSIQGSFFRSTDAGSNWSAVSNVVEVRAFGFGKAAAGGYPAVFIMGWVSGVWGIWRSDDNCSSWTKIGDFPLGIFDDPTWIEGDMSTYGKCYVGYRGTGCVYYG